MLGGALTTDLATRKRAVALKLVYKDLFAMDLGEPVIPEGPDVWVSSVSDGVAEVAATPHRRRTYQVAERHLRSIDRGVLPEPTELERLEDRMAELELEQSRSELRRYIFYGVIALVALGFVWWLFGLPL